MIEGQKDFFEVKSVRALVLAVVCGWGLDDWLSFCGHSQSEVWMPTGLLLINQWSLDF